ncbi:MAG: GNAT family N-acetyltransferase [Pseudomonadota bacterium]|nr:GNAT family N-acetyltransferase [Pseudomonadota bacterium]
MAEVRVRFAPAPMLATRRLLMRGWREADLAPFAAMGASPEVMRYFPFRHDRAGSDRVAQSIQDRFRAYGFGFWAVETVDAPFIGFVGLSRTTFRSDFSGAVELGWRLARRFWGKGYATEAARAALHFAFERAGASEVVAFTPEVNLRSVAVMRRLGMRHDGGFDHPNISPGPLKRFALYRIDKEGFEAAQS